MQKIRIIGEILYKPRKTKKLKLSCHIWCYAHYFFQRSWYLEPLLLEVETSWATCFFLKLIQDTFQLVCKAKNHLITWKEWTILVVCQIVCHSWHWHYLPKLIFFFIKILLWVACRENFFSPPYICIVKRAYLLWRSVVMVAKPSFLFWNHVSSSEFNYGDCFWQGAENCQGPRNLELCQ